MHSVPFFSELAGVALGKERLLCERAARLTRGQPPNVIRCAAMRPVSRDLPHTIRVDYYAATVAFLRSSGSAVRCTLRLRGDGTVSFAVMAEDELLSVSEQRRLVDIAVVAAGWNDRRLFVDTSVARTSRRVLHWRVRSGRQRLREVSP